MSKEEEIIENLQSFGLTKYESEVYFLLLKYRVLTVSNLRRLSKVPLTRIYDVAQSLTEKGLIGLINHTPKEYCALPFEDALKTLISAKKAEFSKKIDLLEEQHKNVSKDIASIPEHKMIETKDFIYILNGKKTILRTWHTLFTNATKEVFIFSGDSSWMDSEQPRLKGMIAKKIDVRILANSKNPEILKKAAKIGVKIRLSDNSLRGVVADAKYTYLSKRFSSDMVDEDYSCILIEDKNIIDSIREYFLLKWNAGKPIE